MDWPWWLHVLGVGGITALVLGIVYSYMRAVEYLWDLFNRDL